MALRSIPPSLQSLSAEKILKQYAETPDGLTQKEAEKMGIPEKAAKALTSALGTGSEGIFTEPEQKSLLDEGFSRDFVKKLAGDDGKKALQARAKWLGENAVTRWWRWDYDYAARSQMVQELAKMGPEAAPALPQLIEILEDCGDDIGLETQEVVGRIGKAAVDPLLKAFNANDNLIQRSWLAGALVKIGTPAVLALAEVLEKSSDLERRRDAANALWQIGKGGSVAPADAKDAVPTLVKVLKDSAPKVQEMAAVALGSIGFDGHDAEAKTVLPELTRMLFDSNESIRRAAVQALEKVGGTATPALIYAYTHDTDSGIRLDILRALGKMGPQIPLILLTYAVALQDESYHNRFSVLTMLQEMGPAAKDLVPDLIRSLGLVRGLDARDFDIAASVASDQDWYQKDPKGFYSFNGALLRVLESENKPDLVAHLKRRAAYFPLDTESGCNLEPGAAEKAQFARLRERLLAKAFKLEIMLTLAAIGPEAKAAIPAALDAAESQDPKVRDFATEVLKKIQGTNP